LRGIATLENGANMPLEFIDGQHPHEDKEFLSQEVRNLLGVDRVWVRGPDWIE
jgi:hypothetical protein